jgi:hypothetical protein
MATIVKASIGDPAILNISSYRNDSIDDFEITIYDVETDLAMDLSVYDAIVLQIKNDAEDSSAQLEFTKVDGSILWSVDAGGIEVGDGSDGKITLRKNMTLMEALGANKFVWDVQFLITASNKRNTLVKGTWDNTADVTR